MKNRFLIALLSLVFCVQAVKAQMLTASQEILAHRDSIKDIMQRVVAFQEKDFGDKVITDWKVGTFYSGVYAAYQATGDEVFYQSALRWCRSANWT
ncbi:MAG: hypothetical protein JXM68_04495, partial [Sedimentisphaerales bacterium]|nr:hypothetical protein [Sedimentisphaerales bacterium]